MSWTDRKLGDYFEITSSKRVFQSEWKKSGVPFYRAREIVKLANDGAVDNKLFISREMYDEYKKKYGIPLLGDLLVTGVGTLGKVYIVKEGDVFYFKDGNIIWLKKKKEIDTKFVDYALKTPVVQRYIQDSPRATVGTYTISKAKETVIPVPPLVEQKRIAAILDNADALRRKRQQAIDLADQFLRAVFLDMFGDPLAWDIQQPPDEWEVKPIGEIAHLKRGYDLPVKNRIKGGVPVCAANGVVGFHNEEKVEGPGVITGRSGTLGSVQYAETSFWPLNTTLYVTNFFGNEARYIEWFLRFYKLDRFHRGAGVPTLNRNLFLDEKSLLPPIELQKKFCGVLSNMVKYKELYSALVDEPLFESISQKAFAGDL